LSVFGHIARLTQGTPAHNALHCQVDLASGRSLGRDWRRRSGRPCARWTDQLCNNTRSVPANMGPWWSNVMARAGYAMTTKIKVYLMHLPSLHLGKVIPSPHVK